jgi:hypothetical protein
MQSFRVPPGRDRTTSLHLSKEKAKKSGDTIPKGKKKGTSKKVRSTELFRHALMWLSTRTLASLHVQISRYVQETVFFHPHIKKQLAAPSIEFWLSDRKFVYLKEALA